MIYTFRRLLRIIIIEFGKCDKFENIYLVIIQEDSFSLKTMIQEAVNDGFLSFRIENSVNGYFSYMDVFQTKFYMIIYDSRQLFEIIAEK